MRRGRPARSSGPGPGLGMLRGGTVTLCLQRACRLRHTVADLVLLDMRDQPEGQVSSDGEHRTRILNASLSRRLAARGHCCAV